MQRLFTSAGLWAYAALLLLALQACSSMNTISAGGDRKLMLKGHDPVAYFTDGKHVLGKPDIKAEHNGVTYRFASAEHRDLFVGNPLKYAPQYGGFCSNGAVYGIPWGGDPDTFKIVDGRLFIFGGHKSMDYWSMDQKRNLQLGDQYWETEMKDRSAVLQRWYRLVFRVPHYKTGKQLEAEWQQRQTGRN
jgi:YHS domain-containing protein